MVRWNRWLVTKPDIIAGRGDMTVVVVRAELFTRFRSASKSATTATLLMDPPKDGARATVTRAPLPEARLPIFQVRTPPPELAKLPDEPELEMTEALAGKVLVK